MTHYGRQTCISCHSKEILPLILVDQDGIPPGQKGHELVYAHLMVLLCHPLKGPCQEGKLILSEKIYFLAYPHNIEYQHLCLCRDFFRISVTVFAVPVTFKIQFAAPILGR